MRFVLDHDVDSECRTALIHLGHEAWTVGEAGRALAPDTDQLIYSQSYGAVLLTHDQRFFRTHKEMPIGRLVRMKCNEWEAPDLLRDRLDGAVLDVLGRHQDVFVELFVDADPKYFYGSKSKKLAARRVRRPRGRRP